MKKKQSIYFFSDVFQNGGKRSLLRNVQSIHERLEEGNSETWTYKREEIEKITPVKRKEKREIHSIRKLGV